MNLILAVRATLDSDKVPTPTVPPAVKDALRPVLGSTEFWMVAILVALTAWAFSPWGPKWARIGAVVFVGLNVWHWLDSSGVAVAAVGGSREKADQGLVALALGGLILLMFVGLAAMKKRKTHAEKKLAKLQADLMIKSMKAQARKGTLNMKGGGHGH